MGADIATIPPKVFYQMLQHPLTAKGIAAFTEDHRARAGRGAKAKRARGWRRPRRAPPSAPSPPLTS